MFVSDLKLGEGGGNNPNKNDGLLTNWALIYHAILRGNRSSNLDIILKALVLPVHTGSFYYLKNNSKGIKNVIIESFMVNSRYRHAVIKYRVLN